eukprot:6206874-Pleurochrysis_carterae.AAC.2
MSHALISTGASPPPPWCQVHLCYVLRLLRRLRALLPRFLQSRAGITYMPKRATWLTRASLVGD